ncbi:CPBP family intramembrane glutamic endopeptidase [Trichothermofontia sp.]
MTTKQLVLTALTLITGWIIGLALLSSWHQPQIQSQLELYQTNLVLQASDWRLLTVSPAEPEADQNKDRDTRLEAASNPVPGEEPVVASGLRSLLGPEPLSASLAQYQKVRAAAVETLKRAQQQAQPTQAGQVTGQRPSRGSPPATQLARQTQQLIADLDLQLGLLQVQQGETAAAIATWAQVIQQADSLSPATVATAQVLWGFWQDPPQLLPDAERRLQPLEGWFRYQALHRLYQLQQRPEALAQLEIEQQQAAQRALLRLAIVNSIPILGLLVGSGLLIFLVLQRLLRGKEALLARHHDRVWPMAWDGETIWQVLVLFFLGQFVVGQIFLPIVLQILGIQPANLSSLGQALYYLAVYALLISVGLSAVYFSIRPFLPLPSAWFSLQWRGNWVCWGVGGYLVALPLVILVSLLNQRIWQGQGGSNPLLSTILASQDWLALLCFFITASIAAPLFEEFLFRGFLLASLTPLVSVNGAIVGSALVFAVAHLSLSEVLPLFVLGLVLGVVYTRSQNLLAPMLLHGLWNSGTLVSLVILGSGHS